MNLWGFVRAYNQPGISMPLPSYIVTFVTQATTRRIVRESDVAVRLVGRCVEVLVVKKLVAGIKSHTNSTARINDEDLACLSAILGIKRRDTEFSLVVPTTVELASMVSLALGDVGSLVNSAMPSDVLHIVQQTLQLDQSFARVNTWDFDHVIASRLHTLLQICISGTSPFTGEVRRSCLRLFLKTLWYCAKAYHQPSVSNPLSPHFLRAFATAEIARHIQQEEDRASRVIGRCFKALVVTKLASGFNLGTVHARDHELVEYLSTVLGAEERAVELWIHQPGAIEHISLFSLAFSEVGSMKTSWIDNIDQSDAPEVVQQTFSILSQTLPAGLNAKPWPDWTADLVHKSRGEFTPILQHRLGDILKGTLETQFPTNEGRIMCLKSLWYYGMACHHLRGSGSLSSAWNFIPISIMPGIARRIYTEENLAARLTGCCFVSFAVNKLAASFSSNSSDELAYLFAILGTENRKAIHWLNQPGAVQLVNLISLTLGAVSSLVTNTVPVPPDVLHIVGQTISILSQDLPFDLKVELQLHQADALRDCSDSPTKSIIVPHLLELLRRCTLNALFLPVEMRTGCLQMYLKGLWHWGKALHQLDASQPLPSQFLDLSSLEFTRHILTERDHASRVMGRCVEALVYNLATRVSLRTDSTVQGREKALAYLSAFHGTENRDVTLWLSQPGAIRLVNIVSLALGDIGSFSADTVPSYALDVVPQTFRTLSQTLSAETRTVLGQDQTNALVGIPNGECKIVL